MTHSTSPTDRRLATLGLLGFGMAVGLVILLSIVAYADRLPHQFGVLHFDKVLHFFMSATLAFFLDHALRAKALTKSISIPRAALVILPIGTEEFLQRFSPVRTSSIWDFVADASGVAIGIWFARFLKT